MDEIQSAISDVLIDSCYGYVTSDYIDLLAKGEEADFTDHDRKMLDILLSCIGMATTQYVIERRYGNSSKQLCSEVMERLRLRLEQSGLKNEQLATPLDLIENNLEVLRNKLPGVNENTAIDVTADLIEPISGSFDNVNLNSSRIHMWLFTFIDDAVQLSVTILNNAEEKYNFTL